MTLKDTQIIKDENSVATRIESDIVYISFVENTMSKEIDIIKAYSAYRILSNNIPQKILFEVQQYATLDKSARDYLEKTKLNAKAVAIVLHSLPQRIIYNFYVNFRKQDHPLKAFKSKKDALDWLNNL